MEWVTPDYSDPSSHVMEDKGRRADFDEESEFDWPLQLCKLNCVCAGQCLRIAVSNLLQLTSLELFWVEMEDAEQQAFRFYHSWRHLRWEKLHSTVSLI